MRTIPFLVVCSSLFAASCASTFPSDPDVVSNLTLLGGSRKFDDSDAKPVEEQSVFGVEFDTYRHGGAVGAEVGIQGSSDKTDSGGIEVEGDTTEYFAGVRKTLELGTGFLRPYIAVGAAMIHGSFESLSGATTTSTSDTIVVPYARVGVYVALREGFNFGLDYRRALFGTFEDDGEDIDADYGQIAATIGFSF